jgi:lysophospholipase L1-like esterase
VGRVDATNPNAVRFAWQGAGLVATVNGTSIAVKLRTEGTSTVYFQPVIDGKMATRFKVDTGSDQTVTLATGLAAADHVVELYRDTEGMYGLSTFLGFTSGTVKGAPPASGRLIEVVGDSISAGYGNLGSEPHPNWVASPACHWTADNSTWYQTYAALAGHALTLPAEVSTIARSGWGMYRDASGNTTGVLSSVYPNALGTNNNAVWGFVPKASVVVINLGTNDWALGDPGTPYETAYKTFIATIRSHYPDAWIFLTIGSMVGEPGLSQVKTHLANVVAALAATGDLKLATFDMGVQNMGADGSVPTGCDWHPNVADHQRMADILRQQLTAKLGW